MDRDEEREPVVAGRPPARELTSAAPLPSPWVAVVGLHSSGASCLAGVLYHLGLHLGNRLGGYYGNDPARNCGFEAAGLAELCEKAIPFPATEYAQSASATRRDLSRWIRARCLEASRKKTFAAGKYPQLCRLGRPLLDACGDRLRVIHIDRPLEESVASLIRRCPHLGARELREHQRWLWRGKEQLLAAASRHLTVRYADLLADPRGEINRLIEYLQIRPGEARIAAAAEWVAPKKRHQTDDAASRESALPTRRAATPAARDANSAESLFQAALERHQAGDVEGAARRYEWILRRRSDHAGAWHLLGAARQQTGRPEEAVAHIDRAIALDGSKAVYHNNRGVALRSLGRLEEARAAFVRALAISARYSDAHSNLGLTLRDLDRPDEAIECLRRALELTPDHADALGNLGNLLHQLGRNKEALPICRRAVELRPDRAAAHNNLGNVHLAEKRFGWAAASYRRALALDPDYADARYNLGLVHAQTERTVAARRYFDEAARLRPDKPLWRLRGLGLCPAVFDGAAEIDQYRAQMAARLDAAGREPFHVELEELGAEGFAPSFALAHHGRDNRALKEKFAALFAPHVPRRTPAMPAGKPRIGFLVTSGHEGGFLRGTGGIVERLDAERFAPVVLCSENVLARCRRAIRRTDVEFVGFPRSLPRAIERIAAARCAVLYHWQIGTDPTNYLLPFARLAPVQCTAWGTHGTSGIAALDYYLSSLLLEGPEARTHYTEKLFLLDTLATYQRRVAAPAPARRAEFGLPETGALYLCPQRLEKFHPDFDPLLAGVLGRDGGGHVVALAGRSEHARRQLARRWEITLGCLAERVVFLPGQTPANFYRLLSLADVVLDPPHYSAGLTGYDIFSLDLPLVTLPGAFNVGRYAAALYRKMDLEDLVARSSEDYIERAVRLGTEADWRRETRARIAARSDALFEDEQAAREHERFFEEVIR